MCPCRLVAAGFRESVRGHTGCEVSGSSAGVFRAKVRTEWRSSAPSHCGHASGDGKKACRRGVQPFEKRETVTDQVCATPSPHVAKPTAVRAVGRNQGWLEGFTYLPPAALGGCRRLYLNVDIYSRREVLGASTSGDAAARIVGTCLRGTPHDRRVVHADNESSMKGGTMLASPRDLRVFLP